MVRQRDPVARAVRNIVHGEKYFGKAQWIMQTFPWLAMLAQLSRLVIPVGYVVQEMATGVVSRGACIVMYLLGVAVINAACMYSKRTHHPHLLKTVSETAFLILCTLAANRASARVEIPLVVFVFFSQIIHRQGVAWGVQWGCLGRAFNSLAHVILVSIAVASSATLRDLGDGALEPALERNDDALGFALMGSFAAGVLSRDLHWVDAQATAWVVQGVLALAHIAVVVVAAYQVLPFDVLAEVLPRRHFDLSTHEANQLRILLRTLVAASITAPLPRESGAIVYRKLGAQFFSVLFTTLFSVITSDSVALLVSALTFIVVCFVVKMYHAHSDADIH